MTSRSSGGAAWGQRRLLAGCGVVLVAALAAAPAHADVSGPCDATIAGAVARGRSAGDPDDAIPVGRDDTIVVTMTSPGGLQSHDLQLGYAGITWTVTSDSDEGQTSVTDEISVSDYSRYGVGLYRVMGEARLSDGSICKGAVLVDVQGNPLTTVAGVVAAGMMVGGTAGVAGATIREARRPKQTRPA